MTDRDWDLALNGFSPIADIKDWMLPPFSEKDLEKQREVMNNLDLKIGSLFSGIGGFELGLEWAGLGKTVWQVEIDDFCNKVLELRWPDAKRYKDVREVGRNNLDPVDLICGGFPCQPFSVAGKRRGKEDDRFLWHEMLRVIAEVNPAFVIGENVPGIINMALDQVLTDLENIGYETATFIIPACAVNAPHRRDRVFVIAYSGHNGGRASERGKFRTDETGQFQESERKSKAVKITRPSENDTYPDRTWQLQPEGIVKEQRERTGNGTENDANACDKRLERGSILTTDIREIERGETSAHGSLGQLSNFSEFGQWNQNWIEVATEFCRMDDVVSNRMDRLKCLGNAVVPQVSYAIGLILKDWIISNSIAELEPEEIEPLF